MTQSHSLLLLNVSFEDKTLLDESHLSSNLLRHIKALRIERGENLDFLSGTGQILQTRCSQTKPYAFEVLGLETNKDALPHIHLFLSSPRKDSLGQTLSQSTEMGVRKISFLKTDHCDVASKEHEKIVERAQRVLEASVEQCRAPFLPTLSSQFKTLKDLPENTPIFFADEDLSRENILGLKAAEQSLTQLRGLQATEWVLLVGPEGGWSQSERDTLSSRPHTFALGLGAQILKVPTACVAALYQLQIYRQLT